MTLSREQIKLHLGFVIVTACNSAQVPAAFFSFLLRKISQGILTEGKTLTDWDILVEAKFVVCFLAPCALLWESDFCKVGTSRATMFVRKPR